MKGKNGLKFMLVILIIAMFTYFAAYGLPALGITSLDNIRYGIDIRGGVGTTLYPDLPEGQKPSARELEMARTIIEKRLDSKSIFDKNLTVEEESGRIILEIPYKQGETDNNPQKAIDEIGETARLTFQEVDENMYSGYLEDGVTRNYLPTGRIVIEGKNVKEAGVGTDPQTGQVVVTLKLDSEGAEKFSEATGRLVGQKISIFMDDQLITAPIVNERIPNGEAVINGQRDAKEAGELADIIEAGALPFKLVAREINSITPQLGMGALKVTVNAGIIAFLLVFLFMLLYYRLPGMIANIALFGLVIFELLLITWFGISLTLPGIAGIILSIGMGVDANIIIFERIKEEMKTGKTLRASIDVGFKRAFSAILDANVTTVISAGVLYMLGSGPIKGFAATLLIGVMLSFLTAIFATSVMLRGVSGIDIAKQKWLYGYKGV